MRHGCDRTEHRDVAGRERPGQSRDEGEDRARHEPADRRLLGVVPQQRVGDVVADDAVDEFEGPQRGGQRPGQDAEDDHDPPPPRQVRRAASGGEGGREEAAVSEPVWGIGSPSCPARSVRSPRRTGGCRCFVGCLHAAFRRAVHGTGAVRGQHRSRGQGRCGDGSSASGVPGGPGRAVLCVGDTVVPALRRVVHRRTGTPGGTPPGPAALRHLLSALSMGRRGHVVFSVRA